MIHDNFIIYVFMSESLSFIYIYIIFCFIKKKIMFWLRVGLNTYHLLNKCSNQLSYKSYIKLKTYKF